MKDGQGEKQEQPFSRLPTPSTAERLLTYRLDRARGSAPLTPHPAPLSELSSLARFPPSLFPPRLLCGAGWASMCPVLLQLTFSEAKGSSSSMPLLPAETKPGLKLGPKFMETRGQEWILGSLKGSLY